jgi:hypothetical protein
MLGNKLLVKCAKMVMINNTLHGINLLLLQQVFKECMIKSALISVTMETGVIIPKFNIHT